MCGQMRNTCCEHWVVFSTRDLAGEREVENERWRDEGEEKEREREREGGRERERKTDSQGGRQPDRQDARALTA